LCVVQSTRKVVWKAGERPRRLGWGGFRTDLGRASAGGNGDGSWLYVSEDGDSAGLGLLDPAEEVLNQVVGGQLFLGSPGASVLEQGDEMEADEPEGSTAMTGSL